MKKRFVAVVIIVSFIVLIASVLAVMHFAHTSDASLTEEARNAASSMIEALENGNYEEFYKKYDGWTGTKYRSEYLPPGDPRERYEQTLRTMVLPELREIASGSRRKLKTTNNVDDVRVTFADPDGQAHSIMIKEISSKEWRCLIRGGS